MTIPQLLHVGSPHELYPYRWSVLAWLDGRDAWTSRHEIDEDSPRLAARPAEVVTALGALGHGLPVPKRAGGDLGIPIRPHIDLLLEQLDRAGPRADRDPARDLAPAWSILGPKGRQVFREILLPDEASWARGRALEVGHTVDAVLHYLPRRNAVGDVFAATLNRILADS